MKFILLLVLLCCGAQSASALEARVALSDYPHDIWTGKDGAPGEVAPRRPITALTALRAGDLLIGPVSSAVRDAGGVLWAATTTNGLLQLKDGAWRDVGEEMGLPKARLSNIIIDQYQQMWLAAGDQLMLLVPGAQR